MDYFYSVTDSGGRVHSIDNVTVEYYVQDIGTKSVDRIIESLQEIHDRHENLNYWERLNIKPCSKYSWYSNAVHLDTGIYLLIGHYVDFDRDDKVFTVFPMLKLEINPNKHAGKPVFKDLMDLIARYCYDARLVKYDYAIDIPVVPDDVQVFGSNKEKGLYKGTRYYGQRNKNGYCKIYDKQKEQGLDFPLTRVEHTISLTKGTKSISFEKVYVRSGDKKSERSVKSRTDTVILELCALCDANGLDYEDILNKLEARKKRTIRGQLAGAGYDRLEFDEKIHGELLEKIRDFFHIGDLSESGEPEFKPAGKTEYRTDEEGFILLDYVDLDLPFE